MTEQERQTQADKVAASITTRTEVWYHESSATGCPASGSESEVKIDVRILPDREAPLTEVVSR